MLATHLIDLLTAIVGPDNITTSKQDMICYGYDATQMEFLPDAVVHPANCRRGLGRSETGQPRTVSRSFRAAPGAVLPVVHSPRGAGSCW